MLRLSRIVVVAKAFATALLLATAAHANGRFPQADHLVVAPTNPSLMVLRTTFGILFSTDKGQNWDWTCEKSAGYGGVEDPSIGITASSVVIAGTFEGVAVSNNVGCDWKFAGGGLADQVIVDVVVRPDSPHAALVLVNKYSFADDAGKSVFNTNIFATTDDAKNFAVLGGPIDTSLLFETIEVAKSDPMRIYLSGIRTSDDAGTTGAILVSKDGGGTWVEHALPLLPIERGPFIAAVDPNNAQRVYVRTSGPNTMDQMLHPNRLLVSDDGGATFRTVYTSKDALLGFVLSPDGSTVYVGGKADGLLAASSTDLVFKPKSKIQVQCLAAAGTTLYACSNEVSGFILGSSTDQGATFAPMLHLSGLRGPLACAPNASQAICIPDWPTLRDSLGTTAADAGSVSDGGPSTPDAGPVAAPSPKGGCGCADAGTDRATLALVGVTAAILAAMAAFARRRRSR